MEEALQSIEVPARCRRRHESHPAATIPTGIAEGFFTSAVGTGRLEAWSAER
ncbi:hypothetical protein RIA37_03570 [Agromyces sp. LY-1358]|nr:hypothetical protein [Agromyces sp. LY-1358]